MSKFNVGDRVRRTEHSWGSLEKGKEYVIKKVDCNDGLSFDESGYWYSPAFFELVEPALTIDKVTEWLSENGYSYFLQELENDIIRCSTDRPDGSSESKEHEFQWGEEVEVRDSKNVSWISRTFVGINPNEQGKKYIAVSGGGRPYEWNYCRKPKTKVTLDEIAKWKGVDKDRIEIE